MSTYTFSYNGRTKTIPEVKGDLMKFSSIVVQDGFQIIPKYCYRAFKNLSHCTLPDSITYIGDEAFIGTKITSFRIGPEVKLDPGNPFDGANMLKQFTIDPINPYYTVFQGVLYSKDMKSLISFPPANPIKSFVVPSTVVEILNFSMKNCQYVENIVNPVSVKRIGCLFIDTAPKIKYTTIVYYKSKPFFHCRVDIRKFFIYSQQRIETHICKNYMLHHGTYLLYLFVPVEVYL